MEAGLGFRGLVLQPMSDELTIEAEVPGDLRLTPTMVRENPELATVVEQLLGQMQQSTPSVAAEAAPDIMDELRQLLIEQVDGVSRVSTLDTKEGVEEKPAEYEGESEAVAEASCTIELGAYNPGFWNNNATIRSRNNCYNYASDKRTDTFAQPGRGAGSMYKSLTCNEVTRAALADGLHRRFNCFPESQKPRYLVALVIWPGATSTGIASIRRASGDTNRVRRPRGTPTIAAA